MPTTEEDVFYESLNLILKRASPWGAYAMGAVHAAALQRGTGRPSLDALTRASHIGNSKDLAAFLDGLDEEENG
jgi:hypothetical protein